MVVLLSPKSGHKLNPGTRDCIQNRNYPQPWVRIVSPQGSLILRKGSLWHRGREQWLRDEKSFVAEVSSLEMSFLYFRVPGSCWASEQPATAPRQTRRRILNSSTKAQQQTKESAVQACWEPQPVQTPYVPHPPSGSLDEAKENSANKWWPLLWDKLWPHLVEIFCKPSVITSILYKVQCPVCSRLKSCERKMFQVCIWLTDLSPLYPSV